MLKQLLGREFLVLLNLIHQNLYNVASPISSLGYADTSS